MDLPNTFLDEFHNEKNVRQMKYTSLGKTGLKLSKLGVGGASLGNVYGVIDENEGIGLVREAIKQGVNYVDTAPLYGNTLSETLIGKALKGVPRQTYHISTKVGRYGSSWDFDCSAERVLKDFDVSLKRLGLDYVDIVFVHDIEFSPMKRILTEALPAVQTLVDRNKARYIGISGYPVSVLSEAVEKSSVKIDVVLSYARDCLIDKTMETYTSFFQGRNIGLINASVTGMGLLTNSGPPNWHPAVEKTKKMCHTASLYCQEKGVELGNLAISDAMQRPTYSSHLVGMKTLDELQRNLHIATSGLSEEEFNVLSELKQRFFDSTENHHWEGVDIAAYEKYKKTSDQKS